VGPAKFCDFGFPLSDTVNILILIISLDFRLLLVLEALPVECQMSACVAGMSF